MPVITALRRLRQEDEELEASLGYTVRDPVREGEGEERGKGNWHEAVSSFLPSLHQ
jgi:hypothetical protein